MSCNCKTTGTQIEQTKPTLIKKVGGLFIVFLIGLIGFPIMFTYVMFLISKGILTGKNNKIYDIVITLRDSINKLVKERKSGDQYDEVDEYDLDDIDPEELELMDLITNEELQNKN